jgi:DNA-3-methyladenine glycosylase
MQMVDGIEGSFAGDERRYGAVLDRAFYQRPTSAVARDLLGKVLVSRSGDDDVAVRLSEVEAYLGPEDPACHTAGGRRTPRVRSMWGDAGHAYVYLIYGIHHCLNVVTVGGGAGEAVLLRGAAVVRGAALVRCRRGPKVPERDLVNGPGKLAQALAVEIAQDGADLCRGRDGLWIADDGFSVDAEQVVATPRIGVDSAGAAAAWPLRFVWNPR